MAAKDVQLRVREARQEDVGRGMARVDPDVVEQLGLQTGDALAIRGPKRTTVALVWPGFREDAGTGTLRIDGAIRRNAGVGLDDTVTVQPVKTGPARRVVLAPTEGTRVALPPALLARNLEGRAVMQGDVVEVPLLGHRAEFVVQKLEPGPSAILGLGTAIEVQDKAVKPPDGTGPRERVTYEDIGGLDEQVQRVREMIELPLRFPELFEKLGVEPPKGVLLYGPPGTGKTLLAKAVASETQASFLSLSGPEVMSKFYGESEERLRELFQQAQEQAPSILFIDEIDSIAPSREEVTGEVERRVVAQLLSLMDGLQGRGKVVVIGATNRPDSLDPALRRPGRLDREVEIGIPDERGRLQVLRIHTRGMPLAKDVDLKGLAARTHGFVGADLAALAREAAMRAVRRVLPRIDLGKDNVPPEVLQDLQVTREDFEGAFRELEPSALREVALERPNVPWSAIGGLEEAKAALQEAVEWPLRYPKLFEQAGAQPARGILLHGPPGTGKTLLAKAVATEAEANFIGVKGPEFFSKWVGESEKAVRETFRKARSAAPCVVFFDELDALASARGSGGDSHVGERVVSQLLTELDGIEPLRGVVVLGATNRPDLVDPALLRPGRFDRLVEIPMPDEQQRQAILRIHLPRRVRGVTAEELAKRTEHFSGADLAGLCREATMAAVRRHVRGHGNAPEDPQALEGFAVLAEDFEEAFRRVRPSDRAVVDEYERLSRRARGAAPRDERSAYT